MKTIYLSLSINGTLRSEGCSNDREPYAKQFAEDEDFMALGYWYSQINAQVGDLVWLIFIFPVDIVGRLWN